MDHPNLAGIKLVVLDVDGVLTDGGIILDDAGVEYKRFDVRDGSAIKWLQRSGVKVCIMSGRRSAAVDRRAAELSIELVYQKVLDKGAAMDELIRRVGVSPGEVAFIGDDLLDVPAMKKVGFTVAVADAPPEVKAVADYVTAAAGGRGAVREFCEHLMKANGSWGTVVGKYLQ